MNYRNASMKIMRTAKIRKIAYTQLLTTVKYKIKIFSQKQHHRDLRDSKCSEHLSRLNSGHRRQTHIKEPELSCWNTLNGEPMEWRENNE